MHLTRSCLLWCWLEVQYSCPASRSRGLSSCIPACVGDVPVEGEAYLLLPKGTSQPRPLVVMAPGLGQQRDMGPLRFATVFAEKGIACLVLDYRTFGGSDGWPRNFVSPLDHVDDILSAVAWVKSVPTCPLHVSPDAALLLSVRMPLPSVSARARVCVCASVRGGGVVCMQTCLRVDDPGNEGRLRMACGLAVYVVYGLCMCRTGLQSSVLNHSWK